MNITTKLQDPFKYSIIPIIVVLLLILTLLVLYYLLYRSKNKKQTIIINEPVKKDKILIKQKYLKSMDALYKKFVNNEIDNRHTYIKMSNIIRSFVYEMTEVKVQNYTLEEIRQANMPELTKLVAEYYEPEFSKESSGNAIDSLQKTRKSIEQWY